MAVAGGAEVMLKKFIKGPDPLVASISQIPTSESGMLIEQARQHMILMTAATKTFKVVGTVTVATIPQAASGGSTAPTVPAAAPDPGTAQAIAYKLLPSFGFSTDQYGCLNNIYTRESGWRYNAYNASGAYGIPQALPGSKMATAGSDWQTNPATQIKWGLGYIKDRYGTPCNAWSFWQAHSWY